MPGKGTDMRLLTEDPTGSKPVPKGQNLTPGSYYRITEIDPSDPDPSLKVGDVVLCAGERAGCISPTNHESDGMNTQWFADYDGEEAYRTLVNGVEFVEKPA